VRRLLVAVSVVLGALGVVATAIAAPTPAGAQDAPSSTTAPVRDEDSPLGDIIPRPGSGQAPDSPNDPGGWQQYLVFGLIVGGMAAIVLLVRWESRRALARIRDDPARSSTDG
jgi:hypothetical protein